MSEKAPGADAPRPAFKVGDVVRLRSGGVDMTVECILTSRLECVWLRDGVVERSTFHEDVLVNQTIIHEHQARMARQTWEAQATLRDEAAKAKAARDAQLKANEAHRSWLWTGL